MDQSFIHKLVSITEPLPLGEMFPIQQPLEVEIGAGDGSFFVAYAKAHPELNLIGLERLLGRLRKIERKSKRLGLRNVGLLRIEASYFVRYLLPADSVSAVHIYFPDPWPKRRHWKNRLITTEFTHDLERPLIEGGVVYLRTDNAAYFAQMESSFAANPNYKSVETPPEISAIITDFERNFNLRGVPTLRAAYQKSRGPGK